MKPRGPGQSGRIPNSSITTSSTKAGTLRPGNSRNSFQKRFARASDPCANRRGGRRAHCVPIVLHHSRNSVLVGRSVNGPMDRLVDTHPGKACMMKINQLLLAMRHPAAVPLPFEGEMPSLSGATAWLNAPPLSAADLRGKVVLVDFWTYTCINWLRTLPYVRAWAEKYREHGVVTIGVHSPEFSFEHDLENVRRAARDMRVDYPIAIDNDFAIWRAFTNHYWPALYLVDAQGHLRYHHFGEGAYELSEMLLQHLLAEAGIGGFDQELVTVDAQGAEAAADWDS